MPGPHSLLPIRVTALRLIAAMAFAVFAGCAATPPAAAVEEPQDESDADAPASEAQALAPEPVDRSSLPNQELTENLLYEFLLAEIAIQRGNSQRRRTSTWRNARAIHGSRGAPPKLPRSMLG